ncbi:copper chaperone PCu(A)C [Rhizobium sp. NTR19]|uniref:Copper chaperone PCu(A)C n=1 Tax=Neorhizobium turbinariae TaxID=2937795 RepID=A0ABT0ILF3_9HYPH|nr:copper chaperone PCu(A)C [Neorhizobium turbinariae]
MKTLGLIALAGLIAVAGPGAASAQHAHGSGHAAHSAEAPASVRVGDLELSGAFTKAMLPGQPVGGGYLTIHNKGANNDRLVSASSPVADMVELHEMAMQGEVMRMRKLNDGIPVAAGATVELKPGGLHLMFMRVKEPFKAGGSVPLTLTFEKAGSVDLVLPVGAAGPAGHQHN